jgi:hypothetical protein
MRPKRRTQFSGAFIGHPRTLVESAALRVLSRSAHLALTRLEAEHLSHGGAENGKLPVTYQQFEEWGVHARFVASALRELQALGIVQVTRHGYAGAADKRAPSLYRLTFVTGHDAGRADESGTHEYLKIKTVEEAEAIAKAARQDADPRNVERGKKHSATLTKCQIPPPLCEGTKANSHPPKVGEQVRPHKVGVLSISREGTRQGKPLAKRALQGAVASERLASASDKFMVEDQSEQWLGAVASKIVDLLPRAPR